MRQKSELFVRKVNYSSENVNYSSENVNYSSEKWIIRQNSELFVESQGSQGSHGIPGIPRDPRDPPGLRGHAQWRVTGRVQGLVDSRQLAL